MVILALPIFTTSVLKHHTFHLSVLRTPKPLSVRLCESPYGRELIKTSVSAFSTSTTPQHSFTDPKSDPQKLSVLTFQQAIQRLQDVNSSKVLCQTQEQNVGGVRKHQIGENVSRKDKINFLVNTLFDLRDSKEDIYGALDAWVAWEQNFPIASLKQALAVLEKEQQWHRVVQVIKWMLSKGQGTTLRTYGQLIRALDMDHRAEEAHKFWVMKIGTDLHSVPWQLCRSMISIYYRNNMLDSLVKLFKGLEAFGREPPEKSIVQRVADAYEMLGLLEEKERVLEKYKDLFTDEGKGSKKYNISFEKSKKRRKAKRG